MLPYPCFSNPIFPEWINRNLTLKDPKLHNNGFNCLLTQKCFEPCEYHPNFSSATYYNCEGFVPLCNGSLKVHVKKSSTSDATDVKCEKNLLYTKTNKCGKLEKKSHEVDLQSGDVLKQEFLGKNPIPLINCNRFGKNEDQILFKENPSKFIPGLENPFVNNQLNSELRHSLFPLLSPPITPPTISHGQKLDMLYTDHFFPNYPESLSPTLLKFGNLMLANQLLNCHFIQTVNKSLQRNLNSDEDCFACAPSEQISSTYEFVKNNLFNQEKNHGKEDFNLSSQIPGLFNTIDPKNLCNLAPSVFLKDTAEKLTPTSRDLFCTSTSGESSSKKNPNTASYSRMLSNPSVAQHPFVENKPRNAIQVEHDIEKRTKFIFPKHITHSTGCVQLPMILPWVHQPTPVNQPPNPSFPIPNQTSKSIPNETAKNSNGSGARSNGRDKRCHRCGYCGKLYSRKYGLKIHIRTHTGYKPLKCKICGRPFGDPSNLNKHVRLHAEGATPYRCQFCGKVLVRRRDLERHINSRHPEKKICGNVGNSVNCTPADPRLLSAN